jgi:hypothetical protein
MVPSHQKIWIAVCSIVRAALYGAWAASKVGAISLATLCTIAKDSGAHPPSGR